jgi:hypothetical protein
MSNFAGALWEPRSLGGCGFQGREGTTKRAKRANDVADGALVIRKAAGQPQLEDLCAGITAENLHSEADWGSPRGKEIW